jgi:GT2 family glycosyltransferase
MKRSDIGIAILSTDRPVCLGKLLKSIDKFTNHEYLSVLVIDDSSDPEGCEFVCEEYDWCTFFHTGERIGVAQNTNRAMWSIAEHPYKLILNNDVEILRIGWEFYYFLAMQQTGIHHFCFQQEGLWGAGTKNRPEEITTKYGRRIKTIHNYPQGAILAYDQEAFGAVGYFDCLSFRGYGKSHWDWSFRVSESGIQPEGIHDVVGSNDYFKVHDVGCTTPQKERIEDYKRNTKILEKLRGDKSRIYISYE